MEDPVPQFSHLISSLRDAHPDLAYIHVVEPRTAGDKDADLTLARDAESNDFAREIWGERDGSVYIAAGGFDRQKALEVVESKGGLVAFGRSFISNVSAKPASMAAGARGRNRGVRVDAFGFCSPTCRCA
jgi:NADPH2 dehydrogenase